MRMLEFTKRRPRHSMIRCFEARLSKLGRKCCCSTPAFVYSLVSYVPSGLARLLLLIFLCMVQSKLRAWEPGKNSRWMDIAWSRTTSTLWRRSHCMPWVPMKVDQCGIVRLEDVKASASREATHLFCLIVNIFACLIIFGYDFLFWNINKYARDFWH